jgi:diguanylate cyclase (GGDEF)-like protein
MTTIYVLGEGFTSASAELAARLAVLAAGRYPVETIDTLSDLQTHLFRKKQAVVVFSAKPEALLSILNECRSVLSSVGFVAVLEDGVLPGDVPVLEMGCHFLRSPFDEFELMNQLAAAVRHCELLAAVAGVDQSDEVTNLFNRRYLMQRLGEEISLSKRHLSPLCCVVLGINLYQIYLDSYGYNFMNALLHFLGDKIGGMIRHEDVVARIGDDEIAILLPRSTEKGAKIFTDRLVHNLNGATFQYGTYEEGVSVCAGVAGYPLPDGVGADADVVIRYARHALHQARHADQDEARVQLFSEIKPAL